MGDAADDLYDQQEERAAERDTAAIFIAREHTDEEIVKMSTDSTAPDIVRSICSFYYDRGYITEKQKWVLCQYLAEDSVEP